MAYGPRFTKTAFTGGKNILASEHLEYVKGGATLDATKFPAGHNELGAQIARSEATGKFEPFTVAEGFDTFSVLNIDFFNDEETDLIAGEVIVRGSVYEAKLPDAVTAEFKAATPLIQYINHIKNA